MKKTRPTRKNYVAGSIPDDVMSLIQEEKPDQKTGFDVIKMNNGREIKFYRLSEAEFLKQDSKRKQRAGLVGYSELSQLKYPGYVTAFLDYFATGEGITRGILIAHAYSEAGFRLILKDAWDEYFFLSCEFRNGIDPLPSYRSLIPSKIKEIIKNKEAVPAGFSFKSVIHLNYS